MQGLRRCFVAVGIAPLDDGTYVKYTDHARGQARAAVFRGLSSVKVLSCAALLDDMEFDTIRRQDDSEESILSPGPTLPVPVANHASASVNAEQSRAEPATAGTATGNVVVSRSILHSGTATAGGCVWRCTGSASATGSGRRRRPGGARVTPDLNGVHTIWNCIKWGAQY